MLQSIDFFLSNSNNKTDRHDIAEILLKVALNTITHPPKQQQYIENNISHTYTHTCKNKTNYYNILIKTVSEINVYN